jgi:alkanesulfonate monooxygenase SsuD/methylene tetrahydromethanopterin reductase-like flavin-dependent oxidoreductase (luciferase family)
VRRWGCGWWRSWPTAGLHNRGPEELEHKLAVLHRHCEKIGRDPKSVRVSYNATCAIYDSAVERRAYVNRYWPGADADKVGAWLESSGIAGSAEHVAEQLRFYVERGAELVILWFQDLADTGSGESTARNPAQPARDASAHALRRCVRGTSRYGGERR